MKGQFFGGRLRAELIAWRYKFDGLQVAIFNSDTTTFTIQNAAGAVNKGLEGSFTFLATDELELRGAFLYVHQKYTDYDDAQCYAGQIPTVTPFGETFFESNYVPELAALCQFDPEVGDVIQDMSGERYGPGPWELKFGFTYDRAIGNSDWFFSFSGDVIWKDKGFEVIRQPNTATPSYVVADFAARIYQPDSGWEVALMCSNCFNEKYVVSVQDKPLQRIGDLTGQVALPRLITLQVTWRFN